MSDTDLKNKEEAGQHDDLGVHPKQREAETAELEDLYKNAPYDQDQDSEEAGPAEPDNAVSLYHPDAKKPRGRIRDGGDPSKWRRRGLLAAGGGGGLLIMVVIVIFLFFLSSLKAIHFATILRSSGFATFQVFMREQFVQTSFDRTVLSDTSTGSIDRPDRTIIERLKGVDLETTLRNLGREGDLKIISDKGNFRGFDLGSKGTISFDDVARKNFDGKAYDELNPLERYRFRTAFAKEAAPQVSEILGTESRGTRNSFFKYVRDVANIKLKKFSKGKEDLSGETPEQAEIDERLKSEEAVSADTATPSGIDQVNQGEAAVAEELATETKSGTRFRNPEIYQKALNKLGVDDTAKFSDQLGDVSTAVFVSTAYCIVHDLNNSLGKLNSQKEERALRYAHDIQTTAQQVESGEISPEAAAAVGAEWDTGDGIPPAENSPFYLAATGQNPQDGDMQSLDSAPTVKINLGPLGWLKTVETIVDNAVFPGITLVPGSDRVTNYIKNQVCSKVVLNPYVQGATALGEIAANALLAGADSGTLAAVKASLKGLSVLGATYGTGYVIGQGLQSYIASMAGTDFSGGETGIDKMNSGFIATDTMNSTLNRGVAYGKHLTAAESTTNKVASAMELRQTYNSQPWQQRYFAIDNPYSLLGTFVARVPSSFATLRLSLVNGLSTLTQNFSQLLLGSGNTFATLFSFGGMQQKAYAADAFDFAAQRNYFGVDQWGWSQDEINRIASDPGFEIQNNADFVEPRNANGELDKKYSGCYNAALQSDPALDDPHCSSSCPPTGECLSSDEALHWRLYKVRLFTIDQMRLDVTKDNGI